MGRIRSRTPGSSRAKRLRRGPFLPLEYHRNSSVCGRDVMRVECLKGERSRWVVRRRSTDREVARDGVGAVRTKEGNAGERVVSEITISPRLGPDANGVDEGEGGGTAVIADQEAIRDLAGVVEPDNDAHGGEVDLLLALWVQVADVPDRG